MTVVNGNLKLTHLPKPAKPGDMAELSDEFSAEPQMGLAAGIDGLEIVDRILVEAQEYLSEHGLLLVEVGNSQRAMMEKYASLPLAWIDFERGGDGVFCISAQDLKQHFQRDG